MNAALQFTIEVIDLVRHPIKASVLVVKLLTHSRTKSLQPLRHVTNLIEIVVQFIFELVVGRGGFKLISAPLCLPLGLVDGSLETATSIPTTNPFLIILIFLIALCPTNTLLTISYIHHCLFMLVTLVLMSTQQLGLLSSTLSVFVECDDRSEDRTSKLFEFVLFVFNSVGMTLGDIKVTFSVGKFLYIRSLGQLSIGKVKSANRTDPQAWSTCCVRFLQPL
jgi:hypothetical protein